MVERIPKPPKIDIINSARGKKTEGYKHQLYFHYPKKNGIQALFDAYYHSLDKRKTKVLLNKKIYSVSSNNKKTIIKTSKEIYNCDKLISTIPLNELCTITKKIPSTVIEKSKNLKYNSIIIALVNVKRNVAGNNFAFMVPQKDIIFHRISKLDFFGKNYSNKNSTTFLVEITFKQTDMISRLTNSEIQSKIYEGLNKLKFCKTKKDINFIEIKN